MSALQDLLGAKEAGQEPAAELARWMTHPAFVVKGLPPPGILLLAYVSGGVVLAIYGYWWWTLVLCWPSGVYALITYSYLLNGTLGVRLLGKRSDAGGNIPIAHLVVFLPYLALTWGVWWLRHALCLCHEDGFNLIAPGVYLGRYPLRFPCRRRGRGAALPAEQVAVVDLCAEFPALPWVVKQSGGYYRCIPCLDGDMPEDKSALLRVAREVAEWGPGRPVYIHCANGRGRSCCLAALVLILREGGPTCVPGAIATIKQARPQVNVARAQLALMAQVLQLHASGDLELPQRPIGLPRHKDDSEEPADAWIRGPE